MIKAVFFDLDGTLLPMDQEIFTKKYFNELSRKISPLGYEPELLIKGVWHGVGMMVANNSGKTNEEVFWDAFTQIFGEKILKEKKYFDEFYSVNFDDIKSTCSYNENSSKVVKKLKAMGKTLVLATNPIFPKTATLKRIEWAGLDAEDFSIITTYENSYHCKPNLEYYRDLLKELDLKPDECLMVGNDVKEDMVAEALGFNVFLLTDCLINKDNEDISKYNNGNLEKLMEYIEKI